MLDLDKKITNRVSNTTRKYDTPKSLRLKKVELEQLEQFKIILKDITLSDYCSDTKALKVLIRLSKHVNINLIKKALSEIM